MRHLTITPELADGIIASALLNGDWNPDVVIVAAQTAQRYRKTITTDEVVRQLTAMGHKVNDDLTVEWDERLLDE